jgi:beta-N-acetylhexosaminidase
MHSTRRRISLPRLALALLAGLGACALAAGTPAAAPAAPAPEGPDPLRPLTAAERAWVERTLAGLTLRERVAQMVMPWVAGDYVALDSPEFDRLRAWVEEDRVGGFVMSMGLPHSYAAKLDALQALAPVPLLVASDMENGPGMRMSGIYSFPHLIPQGGGTAFPPVMALGAAGDDSLAYALGRVLAAEARAVGVHMAFGPVLDVNSNPANPIINTRSFGEDPALVARMGRAYVRGARAGGLLTVAKHFPGHGDTEADSHLELPTIRADRARLDAVELPPYRAAIEEGIDGVMTAHIAVTGVEGEGAPPATLSPYFMTRLLRGEMGFRGLLFTDAMDMGAVISRYGQDEAAVLAVEAGADVLLMPRDARAAVDAVVAAVAAGRIPEARVAASARRILEAKARAGLVAGRRVDLLAVSRTVGIRAHTKLARTVAERSLTLVRDRRGAVPLRADSQRVLVVTYADASDPAAGVVFADSLEDAGHQVDRARVDARTTAAEFDSLRARADSADAVVAAVFVSPVESAGSVAARGGLPEWFAALARTDRPLVLVSFGTPYLLDAFPDAPAFLLAWGGADVSQRAAAGALLGTVGTAGRLPVSLPPHHARGEGIRRAPRAAPPASARSAAH